MTSTWMPACITIREAKFGRVPAGAAAPHDQRGAAPLRHRARPPVPETAIEQRSSVSSRRHHARAQRAWRDLCAAITTAVGVRTDTVHPRVHDLRHSFAVGTLIGWQRSGVDVDEHIAALSTYLGHVGPADTYWYLSAAPELMELAAERLDERFGARQ